jgi:hypothetical protein
LAPFLEQAFRRHRERVPHGPDDLVLTNREGGSMLRSNFRRQVWRPSLVRAGLLGQVVQLGDAGYRAVWTDRQGQEHSMELPGYREAVSEAAVKAAGGLRFHDLRHCYATWLVTGGVPVNVVQAVMGHEQASTTLNRYTHTPADFYNSVRRVFDGLTDDSLTSEEDRRSSEDQDEEESGP